MSPAGLFTGRFLELVGPDFPSARLGRDFVRARFGAEHVRDLLTWSALNEILTTAPLCAPRLRLFRDGAQVPVTRYTQGDNPVDDRADRPAPRPEALYRELRAGASLVLDSIDQLHRPIAAAADDLMRLVRELVQVNLYLVWGESQGFDTHWDDHDTVIVQLAGSKHWTVHGPGRRFPMKVDTDHDHRPPQTVVWRGVLEPGDVIHVPRGWWHAVRGTGEMSMHLTFGFTRRTGIDWARWLIEQLYDEELFRQDLPRFAEPRRRAEHEDELVRVLTKVISTHRPGDFLAARDRRFPRRPEINLPWPVRFEMPADTATVAVTALLELLVDPAVDSASDPAVDSAVDPAVDSAVDPAVDSAGGRGGVAGPRGSARAGEVRATVSGKTFRFAPAMGPMLRALARERSMTLAALRAASALPEPTLAKALELLLQHHLVVIHP